MSRRGPLRSYLLTFAATLRAPSPIAPGEPAAGRPPPFQLPPDVPEFTGRAGELATLRARLAGRGRAGTAGGDLGDQRQAGRRQVGPGHPPRPPARRRLRRRGAVRRSLAICDRVGDRHGVALALLGLGDAVRMAGGPQRARVHWAAALAMLTSLGATQAKEAQERLASGAGSAG